MVRARGISVWPCAHIIATDTSVDMMRACVQLRIATGRLEIIRERKHEVRSFPPTSTTSSINTSHTSHADAS